MHSRAFRETDARLILFLRKHASSAPEGWIITRYVRLRLLGESRSHTRTNKMLDIVHATVFPHLTSVVAMETITQPHVVWFRMLRYQAASGHCSRRLDES